VRHITVERRTVGSTRVRLARVHHSMHPVLKSHLGDEGEVISEKSGEFVLVKFDTSDSAYGCWWVRPKYLEII